MRLVTGTATVTDLDAALADLADVGERFDCTLQAFDARYVAGPDHLRRAVELADRARSRDEAIARDRAVEVLLYAAGRRQINRALAMGIETGGCPAVVLVAARPDGDAGPDTDDRERAPVHVERPDPGAVGEGAGERERAAVAAVCDRSWFTPGAVDLGERARLRQFFEVSETELSATDAPLSELVCERTALLVVDR
jgi:KEOPS complex subunit Cgi121